MAGPGLDWGTRAPRGLFARFVLRRAVEVLRAVAAVLAEGVPLEVGHAEVLHQADQFSGEGLAGIEEDTDMMSGIGELKLN